MVKLKKTLVAMLVLVAWLMPATSFADSYSSLWNQWARAQQKDQPRTALAALRKIVDKATAERAYGQLLKAQVRTVNTRIDISPDSLRPDITRLELLYDKADRRGDNVLAAAYATVVGRAYRLFSGLCDDAADAKAASSAWYDKALAHPDDLAKAFATGYEPFVEDGVDSRIFGDDMLHIVGMEAGRMKFLHDYYEKAGNRQAACLTALKLLQEHKPVAVTELRKSKYLLSVDSLLNAYRDLQVAGEVAIERYDIMSGADDVEAKDKMAFIDYALVHWGAWPRMNILRNAQSRLTLPSFHVSLGDGVLLPGTRRKVNILGVCNISELTMTVRRLNVSGDTTLDPSNDKGYAKLKTHFTSDAPQTQTRRYIGMPAYKVTRDTMEIEPLPVGVYLVEFTANNAAVRPERLLLRVTNLKVVCQPLPNYRVRMAVLDATTGQPVPGAKVRFGTYYKVYGSNSDVTTYTCDSIGEIVVNERADGSARYYWPFTDSDKASDRSSLRQYYHFYGNDNAVDPQLTLFTDRSIYRPGQTLQASAIAFDKRRDGSSVMTGQKVTFRLHDANGREAATAECVTDSYGTASTSFVLPSNGLTGFFRLSATVADGKAQAYASVRVEEYKRPSFDITYDKLTATYKAGDTIAVAATARTFSGVAVQGAKVRYRVVRRPSLWWGRYGLRDRAEQVFADSAVTDGKGRFEARVPLFLPDREEGYEKLTRFYSFDLTATVTDAGGETHDATTSVPLGDKPTALSCNLPDKTERDSLRSIRFDYRNASGEPVEGNVVFYIDDQRFTAPANTDTPLSAATLTSASHLLTAYCGTDTLTQHFVVFAMDDKKVATHTHDWFYASSERFPSDGSPVYVQVGSSDSVQHIVYSICSGMEVLESGALDLKDGEVSTRQLTYKPDYGDGLLLTCAWVKEGVAYCHNVKIACPKRDNRLVTRWTTFRDRLTPGQKEEWTLHITAPDGRAAKAQAMLTMYDKSLDRLARHSWRLNADWHAFIPITSWYTRYTDNLSLYGEMSFRPLGERSLDFSSFNIPWYGAREEVFMGEDEISLSAIRRSPRVFIEKHSAVSDSKVFYAAEAPVASKAANDGGEVLSKVGSTNDDNSGDSASGGNVAARQNFAETAFFMPCLETDANGDVKVKFTLPESVTTWRVLGLAHDATMNIGQFEGEAVAQKQLMVQPNLPRFVRPHDKGAVAVRLSNLSGRRLSGTSRLELLNPATGKAVYAKSVKFKAEKDTAIALAFPFDMASVPNDGLLICRVTAQAGGFSDGEQSYLPVLAATELVTNAVPFTLQGAGTKSIDLTPLFSGKNAVGRKLTVEYTNNPAWLMVQTLPSAADNTGEDAVSLATAYYVNALGRKLMTLSPSIRQTVEQWKLDQDKNLTSPLQQNGDIKEMILSETPWVADAETETDNMRRLAAFYDENALNTRQTTWLAKLQKLQKFDGSFGWCPGMQGNGYVTLSVATTLARLSAMGIADSEADNICSKAVNWLGGEIARECSSMRKREKKGEKNVRPSDFAADYMYVCAITNARDKMTLKRQNDYDYLVARLARQNAGLSIEGKARAAVVLAAAGRAAEARTLMESMRQYLVKNGDMGCYYDSPKAAYSWRDYRIPTQVAVIETLQRLQPSDMKTVGDMQLWLLQAKRTQGWDTPLNTVDAVSAFLGGDAGALTVAESKPAVLKVDGKTLPQPVKSAGLGYVKTSKEGDGMREFTAEKFSDGTSWGAVYAQSVMPVEDVEKASAGLSVKRVFYKDGKRLDSVEGLKVGDRLTVRLVITADRDYDFVEVSDRRAANMEPTSQLSGYRNGCYVATRDNMTCFFFDRLAKGRHTVEASYYIDRPGSYRSGLCTAQCAYSPAFSARDKAVEISSEE